MQQSAKTLNQQNNAMLLALGYQLNQYEIEAVLAVGDFCMVYYAWDHLKKRNVVIHEYFPHNLAIREQDNISVSSKNSDHLNEFEFGLSEFLLEARLLSQIRCVYLPNVIEYCEANGSGYLISEYDDGRTLREILDKISEQISELQLNEILKTGLRGLRELHARNLLHTRVSPKSLFIRHSGHPLLLGQGFACYRLAQQSGSFKIIPEHDCIPLEQYNLDGNIGPWSDLYALGATLYECIAGIKVIDAATRQTALVKGDDDPLTPAVEIGRGSYSNLLLSNIDWMLNLHVEDRPNSADLMLGVISIQGQYKHIKDFNTPPRFQTNTNKDKTQQAIAPGHLGSDSLPDEERVKIKQSQSLNSRRYIYWGLSFMLLAFLAVTGYQIYQYEDNSLNKKIDNTQDSQTLLNPEIIVSEQVKPDVTQEKTSNNIITNKSDSIRRDFYENLVKEEEIERRVEQELKMKLEAQRQAVETEKKLQLQAQERQQKQQITNLLKQARQAQQAMEPTKLLSTDGSVAYDYYQSVLDLEPNNKIALAGIKEITDTYIRFAKNAIENNDPDKASQFLKKLIAVKADDQRLDEILQQITDLKAQLKFEKQQQLEAQKRLQEKQKLANAQTQKNDGKVSAAVPSSVQAETNLPPQNKTTVEPIAEPVGNNARALSKINILQMQPAYQRYDKGEYSSELFDIMTSAAKSGDGRAQYILVEMYGAGRGVEQNFAESSFWLKQSLDHVNQQAGYRQPWAEKAMGVIYEKGWYVDANSERAFRWYRSSAEKNYAPAQYRLGLAYAKGLGVRKNAEQAEYWFKKAISNGNQDAEKALSKLAKVN